MAVVWVIRPSCRAAAELCHQQRRRARGPCPDGSPTRGHRRLRRTRIGSGSNLDTTATADTIRLVIADAALRAWGVRAVRPLIDALPDIAAQDPALAVDLGARVWLFQDDPSQTTTITNSQIFRLMSNRQQDLESVKYQVGQRFPALAALDVLAATGLFLKIVEGRSPPEYASVGSQTSQRPWVR
jgi:hypothetical protein